MAGHLIPREKFVLRLVNLAIYAENRIYFAPKCPSQNQEKSSTSGGASGGAKSRMAHITIGNIQVNNKRRGSLTISL